jgi:hypothetical protein
MRTREHQRWQRRNGIHVGVAATITAFSLVALASPASAHSNIVSGTTSCALPNGTSYQVTWRISNDWNLPETVKVIAATGGAATVSPLSLTIAASGNGSGGAGHLPFASVTLVQTLPDPISGSIDVKVTGTYSDAYTTSNWGEVEAPTNCAPSVPTTTLPGVNVLPTTGPATAAASATTGPAPVIAASTSQAAVPPLALAATPAPILRKVGRSNKGATRPTVSAGKPVLLANKLPASKPVTPVLKAATFTG